MGHPLEINEEQRLVTIEYQCHATAGKETSSVEVQRITRAYRVTATQRKGRGKQEKESAYNAGDNDKGGERNYQPTAKAASWARGRRMCRRRMVRRWMQRLGGCCV